MQKVTGSTPVTSTEVRFDRTFFMEQFIVYIIYSSTLDRYYVGYTTDLEKRINEHKTGISSYTSRCSDWVLKYTESCADRQTAMRREKEIKNKKSRKYIEKLIVQGG